MEKTTLQIDEKKLNSITMGCFTIHKNHYATVWNGQWVVSWNRQVKEGEDVPSVPGYWDTLQGAIDAVSSTFRPEIGE